MNKTLTLTSFQGDTLSGKSINMAEKEDAGSTSDGLVELGPHSDFGLGVSVTGNVKAIDLHDVNACKISNPIYDGLLANAAGAVQQHSTVQPKFRRKWMKSRRHKLVEL